MVSLYVVAVTVCVAAFAGFHSFSYMLDAADIFPGEECSVLYLPVLYFIHRVSYPVLQATDFDRRACHVY